MAKKFNYKGTCNPEKHYMVDTSRKIEKIISLIEEEEYFTINRPRQFGKSTTLFLLAKELRKKGYIAIKISFGGLGDAAFENEEAFCRAFIQMISHSFMLNHRELAEFFIRKEQEVRDLNHLSWNITRWVQELDKELVLLIDEVDKSSNNQLFLSFLGMLREKYLARNEGEDLTFKSVILAGVHDVKSLKIKITEGKEKKFNSPWNIAIDLPVALTFSPIEIATMLQVYSRAEGISMDIPSVAERLHNFTSGYPFLVSRLCSIIRDDIMEEGEVSWPLEYVDRGVGRILKENNTNFESLIKNLENNPELYRLVEKMLLMDISMEFEEHNSLVKQGMTHGIFRRGKHLAINNLIYKELIYNYMAFNLKIQSLLDKHIEDYTFQSSFLLPGNRLNFEKVLLRFQAFMKEQYSAKDKEFVERNWRLLFLAFIKPIINGHGFDFKEVQVSEEKRLDVVITYYNKKYICELKIWDGEEKHKRGIHQLTDYLERQNAREGFLVIFDFKKEMKYKTDKKACGGRDIFMVWV